MKLILITALTLGFAFAGNNISYAQVAAPTQTSHSSIETQTDSPVLIKSLSVVRSEDLPVLFKVSFRVQNRSRKTITECSLNLITLYGENVMTMTFSKDWRLRPGKSMSHSFHVQATDQPLVFRVISVLFADKKQWNAKPFKPAEKPISVARVIFVDRSMSTARRPPDFKT